MNNETLRQAPKNAQNDEPRVHQSFIFSMSVLLISLPRESTLQKVQKFSEKHYFCFRKGVIRLVMISVWIFRPTSRGGGLVWPQELQCTVYFIDFR